MQTSKPFRPWFVRWRILTVTARGTLTTSFMTYHAIDLCYAVLFSLRKKKVSLLINYFAPRWTLNRSKKLCWELVFAWMIGSTTNSRFRYLSSTLRSRSQLTCRINYLLHPTILSFYFHDLLERISCFKEICLTQPEMGAIL